jgi:hypothetical protein
VAACTRRDGLQLKLSEFVGTLHGAAEFAGDVALVI